MIRKTSAKVSLFLLRFGMGWYFLYAGLSKVLDPDWSAAGYLNNANIFPEFFGWFAQPGNIEVTNFLNQWGLTLIGVSLILGIFVRYSSIAGIPLMLLYYLPALEFPYIEHAFIVDNHIIYILVFVVFITFKAGECFGLDSVIRGKFKGKRVDY